MEKEKNKRTLSSFEEDCIWMSYRYCIGRSTIATHLHAGAIAEHIYNKLNAEELEFMSEDICREIYDKLKWNGIINMGWYGNIPKEFFKPLDIVYKILKSENVNSLDKMRNIKNIRIEWDRKENDFIYEIIWCNHETKFKDYGTISYHSFYDLEVWQKLANLLDVRTHKFCRLIDDTIVEYYEYWETCYSGNNLSFRKIKAPIESYTNFSICTHITEDIIKEDNIKKDNIKDYDKK